MHKQPIKILYLEDEPNDVELLKIELDKGSFDYEITHADSRDSFERELADSNPDIILSDFNIPEYDIFKAMEALRAHDLDASFILITGALGDERAVDLIVNHGVSDYILKDNLSRLNPAILREYNNKQIQNQLNQHKIKLENLSLVASHIHNGVIITNKLGKIEWVNQAYTDLTGYTLEESLGQIPGHILHGKDTSNEKVSQIRTKLNQGIGFSEEILNYHKSGTPYWVKLDISPVYDTDGNLIKFIAIHEDITERKKSEKELRQSHRQLERSQEIGEIGSWTFDVDTEEIYWSDEMYKIYDRAKELGPPSFTQILEDAKEAEDPSVDKMIANAIKKGIPYEFHQQLDFNEPKFIHAIGLPVINEAGQVIGLEGTVQNVTEVKLSELNLLKTTKQLTDVVNNLNGVLFSYALYADGTDRILYISKGVERIYGLTQKEALENTNLIWENIHEDDLENIKRSIDRSAEELTTWDFTWRHLMNDGTKKYLQGRGTPTRQDDGTIIWNTYTIDVTEQIKAEQDKNEFQKLLQSSFNEVYIFEESTLNIVYCNASAQENTQYSEAELKAMTPLDLKKEFTERDYREILKNAAREKGYYFETKQTRKDGSTYDIFVQINKGAYKNRSVYVVNVVDISDRTLAEQFYRETNIKLRRLIESAPIGIYLVNTDGIVVDFWNAAAERIFGYTRKEVMNTFIPSIDETQLDEYKDIMSTLLEGKAISGKRIKRKRKDGSELIVELHTGPVYKDGEVHQILVLVNDVTELVHNETDLKRTLGEKDILIQEIHHRVKNNLAIISGLLELQILRGDELPQLIDTKNRIHTIASLYEQLYNNEDFSDIGVKEYFEKLIRRSKNSFSDKNHQIEIIFDSGIEKLNINEAIPLGLLTNELISNSIKHAFPNKSGSIHLTLSSFQDDKVDFSYSDSGNGFDRALFDNNEGFGLELIHTLTSQLTTDFNLKTDGEFSLAFQFNRKRKGAYSNL